MQRLTRSSPLLLAALVAGVLLAASTPSDGGAVTGDGLAGQADALRRSESAALLQLYAAEASFARAEADLARLQERSERLAAEEREARTRTEIVRRSLAASQRRVARLLRELYVQGEPDPISVLLGATSLDEAVAGIEGLSRATAANQRLGEEAESQAGALARLRGRLADRRAGLAEARLAALAGTRRLATAVAQRRGTLAAIRARQSLTAQRLAALQARAQKAEQQSLELTAAAATATTAIADTDLAPTTTASGPSAPADTQPAGGTRSFVADAVAYHLSGNTASGLPVGVGVIAVDPTVIPLGTRLFIPGYGPAVAADTGSAVKGNIIDLWMPSTAQARAWGRRTVTIIIYG